MDPPPWRCMALAACCLLAAVPTPGRASLLHDTREGAQAVAVAPQASIAVADADAAWGGVRQDSHSSPHARALYTMSYVDSPGTPSSFLIYPSLQFWSYFVSSASGGPAGSWTAMGYDSSGWPMARAQFG